MTDLTKLSAFEAAAAIRRNVITSRQLVEACLARIRERQSVIEAWAHLDEAKALVEADAADERQRAGEALGPLNGVPVGIKDIVDVAGLPNENGSAVFKGNRPERDAALIANLRKAGAVILGKTVTTELAFYGPGPTRNPHNVAHTPGGSSSGSAAAVADFQVPLALGTQTAGSIIRPASFCGIYGLKPTFGLVPREGVLAQSEPLDTIGGYGRTLQDAALFVDCMAGESARSHTPPPTPPRRGEGSARVRLAFVRMPAWEQGEPTMRAALEQFVASRRDVIEEVELPAGFDSTRDLQRLVQFHDIARSYGPIVDAHPDLVSAKLKEVVAEGRTVSEADYRAALARREPLYEALTPLLDRFAAILSPAAPGAAPEGLGSTGSPMFNFLWTYLGAPAVSLPLLEADGLPLGVQMVGKRGEDASLVPVAGALAIQVLTREV